MEETNQTLTTLLRGMVSKSLRGMDTKLAHASLPTIKLLPMPPLPFSLRCAMALTLSLLLILFSFYKNQS